ncbi:MAG: hypothetical protein LBN21_10245 [Treponema sp.]|jgi:DNA repair exonuclease SbcCD ATPase subunit|nr:hypothetical protein [Treponema sp.]
MGLFTAGNLITLGIVVLMLIMFRYIDRSNSTLGKLRKYADKLKEEMAVFAAQKAALVKDYGVDLEVEQKAARELMKRLQITDQELADKAAAVARIDERLNAYDASLEELVKMTARVQENLNRIRDESAFVEKADKQIGEAKDRLASLQKDLGGLELRFERDNASALERTASALIASVKSTVSDLEVHAETIERQVEDHREAVDKIEEARAANLERDMAIINKVLTEAVEQAGQRADKMEDAALVKLRDSAQERVRRLQTALEEKFKTVQDNARARIVEMQDLLKAHRDEWKTENGEIEVKQKAYRDEWKKDVQELNVLARSQREGWAAASKELDAAAAAQRESRTAAVQELDQALAAQRQSWAAEVQALDEDLAAQQEQWAAASKELDAAAAVQREKWGAAIGDAERQVLEGARARLDEYKATQAEEFKQLETLADDAAQLESELRRVMADAENRVQEDFALFEEESANERATVAAEFTAQARSLKADMDGVEKELNTLKSKAYDNVSEKLKLFEDDFFADLSRRSGDIDSRFTEWRESVDARLEDIAEESGEKRRALEISFNEDLRKNLTGQGERLLADLERLKVETGAFEAGIREEMQAVDETRASFLTQLDRDLAEVRETAEAAVKVEIGRYALSSAETLKQNQRELEAELKEISGSIEKRNTEVAELLDTSRRNLEEWQAGHTGQMRDIDAAMEESRRRIRELSAENEERIAQVRSAVEQVRAEADAYRQEIFSRTEDEAKNLNAAVEDADRHIREFTDQTKLFAKTDELRTELERRIEDMRSDIDRLDQRKSEAAQMEGEFVRIKRLGDDVNAKMTRFLLEQRRIEVMEGDFNRLLQTSQAVEEKLVQVSSSDDTLQAVQVQIRRLDDAIKETEEKYQRIEKKNLVLDTTNAGIDRNLKALQESETAVRRVNDDIGRLSGEMEGIRASLETLSGESSRAQQTAEKLSSLDESLGIIEKRIEDMQVAREWLARTETRLEELNKQAQDQVKLMGAILKDEKGKSAPRDKGAPPIGVRETIVKLARQGWTTAEIARTVKYSVGEVELTLEIAPRDEK